MKRFLLNNWDKLISLVLAFLVAYAVSANNLGKWQVRLEETLKNHASDISELQAGGKGADDSLRSIDVRLARMEADIKWLRDLQERNMRRVSVDEVGIKKKDPFLIEIDKNGKLIQ